MTARALLDLDRQLSRPNSRARAMQDALAARFEKAGESPAAAKLRARGHMEQLFDALSLDISVRYTGAKKATVDALIKLQKKVVKFYDALLRAQGKPDTAELEKLLREMEEHFDELRRPVKDTLRNGATPNARAAMNLATAPATAPAGGNTSTVRASERIETLRQHKKWKVDENGVATRKYDGGLVELREVDGKLQVNAIDPRTGEVIASFKEFDVLATPYKDKPPSSSVVQAHHGCQDALMQTLFGRFNYAGGDAPTLWLRDSTDGSPHGIITHRLQKQTLATNLEPKNLKALSYGKIRDIAVGELKTAGVPDRAIAEYLKAIDKYFDESVLPHIPESRRPTLVGTRKEYY